MKGMNTLLVPWLILLLPAVGHAQFYVSGDVGYANADFSLGEPYNGVIDDNSFAYGVKIGYGVHENVAIQADWHGYTNFDGRAAPCPPGEICPQISTSGNGINTFTLAALPRIALGGANEFEFFGTVGYYRARVDTNIGLADSNFNRRGVVLGAGARWEVNEPWNIHIEARRYGDRMTQFSIGFGWQAAAFRDRQ
jgi:hypothetical protein